MSGGVTGVEREGEGARVISQDKGGAVSFYTTTLKGERSEENGKKGQIKPVKWHSIRTTRAHVHHNRVEFGV